MGLTAFVVGLSDATDPAALERAKTQLADAFLSGMLAPGKAAGGESTWKSEKSATKSRAARRT